MPAGSNNRMMIVAALVAGTIAAVALVWQMAPSSGPEKTARTANDGTSTAKPQALQTAQTVDPAIQRLANAAPTIALEIFVRTDYARYWRFKAIAMARDGTFRASFRAPTQDAANSEALLKCAEDLRWHPDADVKAAGCKLFATADQLIRPKDTAPQASSASAEAPRNVPQIATLQGASASRIVLHVPGCTGKRKSRTPRWLLSWHDFFQAAPQIALVTLQPPKEAGCPKGASERDAWTKARRVQLRAAIAQGRKAHPGKQVWIWGDKLGAAVALVSDRPVDGILLTRYPCTFEATNAVLLPRATVVFTVQSENDPVAVKAAADAGARTVATHCRKAHAQRDLQLHLLKGKKRSAPLWRRPVMEALARTLKVAPLHLNPPATTGRNAARAFDAHFSLTRDYSLFRRNKAMAIGPRGRTFTAAGEPGKAAAISAALWACNRHRTGNGFTPNPAEPCELFAVNDRQITPAQPSKRP